ncbi:MAG: molybdenum cofactor guanylyltransferase [Aquificaceae bacterium]
MQAFIAAGGLSSRFGEDKTLYNLCGKPIIKWVIDALEGFDITILCKDPKKFESFKGVKVYKDLISTHVAMAGLYSALYYASGERILFLSADAPFIKREILNVLIENASALACVFDIDGLQPMPGVYHTALLPEVERRICKGNYSLRALLKSVECRVLTKECAGRRDSGLISFFNINTKQDADFAIRLCKEL